MTMSQFKQSTGVNLAITGTDMTANQLRIFTATTSPNLPVKYAVRISSGIPFYFPTIYWDKKWDPYLGESLKDNMFCDGGVLLNLPTQALASSSSFQEKYLGEQIDHSSIASFSFNSNEKP